MNHETVRRTARQQNGEVTIAIHDGDRSALTPLFALADDSMTEIAGYRDLGTLIAATVDGQVVGLALLLDDLDGSTLDLRSLAVAVGHQGRGIGRSLLMDATRLASGRGYVGLLTSTATADISNLRFYLRNGFRMLRIERDAFTAADGYGDVVSDEGIRVRDRVLLDKSLEADV